MWILCAGLDHVMRFEGSAPYLREGVVQAAWAADPDDKTFELFVELDLLEANKQDVVEHPRIQFRLRRQGEEGCTQD